MTTLHEQARAEADAYAQHLHDATPIDTYTAFRQIGDAFAGGFLAGHEAATADDDARITRLVGVVTATTMLGPQDAETVVRALVAHAATRTRVIATVDELDALPVGSVVLNANGVAFVKTWYDDGGGLQMDRWHATGFEGRWVSEAVIGGGITSPARVLYEPEASQDLHN